MTERELLIDCLQRLNQSSLPYMLTGSMASNVWGIPRTTHDLDFVIKLEAKHVSEIVRLFESDFFIQVASVAAALRPPYQFNAIDNRSALKIDFWVLKQEPFEQQMFARRKQLSLFGVSAWIATPEDVLLHKLWWNKLTPSERQLGDAAGIWALQRGVLDREYLLDWAVKLDIVQMLDKIIGGEIRPKQT